MNKRVAKLIAFAFAVTVFAGGITRITYGDDGVNLPNVYDKLSNGEDVNILVLGDSIGMGSHAGDTAHTWAYQVESYLESTYGSDVYLNNLSMNGNRSYSEYVRVKTITDKTDYDLVILCCGQNDKTKYEYTVYYEALIRAVVQRYSGCQIISVLQSSITKQEKIDSIEGLCSHYTIPIADTIQSFKDSGIAYEDLSVDGVHPNDAGYAIYADTLEALIGSLVSQEAVYNCGNGVQPLYEEVSDLDNLAYYSYKNFTFDGVSTYDMDISGLSGTLGLDMGIRMPDCSIKVYADGELVADIFDTKSSSRLIRPIVKDVSINSHIRIVISDEDVAKSFCGVIISGENNASFNDSSFEPVLEVTGVTNTSAGVKITWKKAKGVKGYAILRKNYGGGSYRTIGTTSSENVTVYTDTTAVPGKDYTYAVRALSETGKGMYKPGISVLYLRMPVVEVKNSKEFVRVSWKKIKGAEGYIVYRRANEGVWKELTVLKGNESVVYHDSAVKSNTAYKYRIQAYSGDYKSNRSDKAVITFVKTPQIKKVKSVGKGILVKIGKIDGACKYIVYRKETDGSYSQVKTINGAGGTSFVDKDVVSGRTYYYKVAAKTSGCLSHCSDAVKIRYTSA